MPVLGLPLLLIGLTALPVAAGIYWLRTRFRQQEVSTLFLWNLVVQAQGGGRKRSRLQTPLALLLELLVIGLLVLAAAAPRVLRPGEVVSVAVVVDDSYSMSALAEGSSSRERAIAALRRELDGLPRYAVRIIAAGAEPRLLGESSSRWSEVEAALSQWRCDAASANLRGAIAMAAEISGPRGRLLVLSDHPMPSDLMVPGSEAEAGVIGESSTDEIAGRWGRLRWRSVGQPVANLAIVNAVRTLDPAGEDLLLVELANLSETDEAADLTLSRGISETDYQLDSGVGPLGDLQPIDRQRHELPAGTTKRLWLRPSAVADSPLVLDLTGDALPADNRVVLMPSARAPIPVRLDVADTALQDALRRALISSGRADLQASDPLLRITDGAAEGGSTGFRNAAPGLWTLRFINASASDEQEPPAYLGPFVFDRDHPLTPGLTLDGVVWSAPRSAADEPAGRPVITAGDHVLVSDAVSPTGQHDLAIYLHPPQSTVLQSAALPVLVWNLLDWRQAEQPGLSSANARAATPVSIVGNGSISEALVLRVDVDAKVQDQVMRLVLEGRRAAFVPPGPGVYEVRLGDTRHRLSVLAGSLEESDLRHAAEASAGEWDDQLAVANEYRSVAWGLGLIALLLLGLHAWLLYRSPAALEGGAAGSGGEARLTRGVA